MLIITVPTETVPTETVPTETMSAPRRQIVSKKVVVIDKNPQQAAVCASISKRRLVGRVCQLGRGGESLTARQRRFVRGFTGEREALAEDCTECTTLRQALSASYR